jgi:hypothetical protein
MNMGRFSAHIPSLAYYIFIGATNSAEFFLEQLKSYFLPRTFFANLTAFEGTKYESLDYVYVQHTRKLTNAYDVFPNKDELKRSFLFAIKLYEISPTQIYTGFRIATLRKCL